MNRTRSASFQGALVAAAAVVLTGSVTTERCLLVEESRVENVQLVNAKPVLGLSRPVKPPHKEYLELVRTHAPRRNSKMSG